MQMYYFLELLIIVLNFFGEYEAGQPLFTSEADNMTVIENSEATLSCAVNALNGYKIAWVHEESQSILSIGRRLYARSKRLTLAVDYRTSAITISPVLAQDRGWYMCQVNTDPMLSSHRYLEVLVPPKFEVWSGPEVEAREGSDVTLTCKARSHPQATVTWRRIDAKPIYDNLNFTGNRANFSNKVMHTKKVWAMTGPELSLTSVNRYQSAVYSCHVDNQRTSSVSRETHLIVTYPPMIWIEEALVGVKLEHDATISCVMDGNPTPIHTWFKNGSRIQHGEKYRLSENIYGENWQLFLTIRWVLPDDVAKYTCTASNAIGQAEGTVSLYEMKNKVLSSAPEREEDAGNNQYVIEDEDSIFRKTDVSKYHENSNNSDTEDLKNERKSNNKNWWIFLDSGGENIEKNKPHSTKISRENHANNIFDSKERDHKDRTGKDSNLYYRNSDRSGGNHSGYYRKELMFNFTIFLAVYCLQ